MSKPWQSVRLAGMNALQAEMDALKRLQTETAADPPSADFGATWLEALRPVLLDRGFKGEL